MLRKGERAAKFYIGNVTIGSISISTKKKKKENKENKKNSRKASWGINLYLCYILATFALNAHFKLEAKDLA